MKHSALWVIPALFLMSQAVGAPKPKVAVCHFDEEEGAWVSITISEAAVQAHLRNHDDAVAGGVTSQTATQLDAACQPVAAPAEEPAQ